MTRGNPNEGGVGAQLGIVSGKLHELKQALQSVVAKEAEIKQLQAETDSFKEHLIARIDQMEAEILEAVAMVVQGMQQDMAVVESLRQEKAALEADLETKDGAIRLRDATISELEEKLAALTQDSEGKMEERSKLREIQRWLNVLSEQLSVYTEENTIPLNEAEVVSSESHENGTPQPQAVQPQGQPKPQKPVAAHPQPHSQPQPHKPNLSGLKIVLGK